jgi:hypothetical protein
MNLLIRDIHALVLMDEAHTILRGGFIYSEGGEIMQIGRRQDRVRNCLDKTYLFG